MSSMEKLKREAETKNMVITTLIDSEPDGRDVFMHPASVVGFDRYHGRYWVAFIEGGGE